MSVEIFLLTNYGEFSAVLWCSIYGFRCSQIFSAILRMLSGAQRCSIDVFRCVQDVFRFSQIFSDVHRRVLMVTDVYFWFQKTSESQTGPPYDRKTSKCLAKWIWFQHLKNLGWGPVQANLGGGQSKQIWGGGQSRGEAQLKETPCTTN